MNEKAGEVFDIAKDNAPVEGCTVSRRILGKENSATCFSLAKNTDISAEIYPYHKLVICSAGELCVYTAGGSSTLIKGSCILTPTDVPVGMRSNTSAVYAEILIGRDDIMNETVKAGEVFTLAELVPYRDGRIVNMDVVHNDRMKLVVMSFDKGTGLSEHAAPGDALIFALEGEGVIGYGDKEHNIKAGENFCFAKGGMHWVKAVKRFKMALLLTFE